MHISSAYEHVGQGKEINKGGRRRSQWNYNSSSVGAMAVLSLLRMWTRSRIVSGPDEDWKGGLSLVRLWIGDARRFLCLWIGSALTRFCLLLFCCEGGRVEGRCLGLLMWLFVCFVLSFIRPELVLCFGSLFREDFM